MKRLYWIKLMNVSEMSRLYWIKFMNGCTQIEKESGWFGKSSWKELWKWDKFDANWDKFGSVFLVKYIYICIKFLMYEILLWELKLVPTAFVFTIKIKLLKNYQKWFYFVKKSSFCPQNFQIFVLGFQSFANHII